MGQDDKGDGQDDGDEDKGKLNPKGYGEDAVLGVVDAKPLVLGADKDGRDEVSNDEEAEEDVMESRVMGRIEDAEADQADGADQSPGDGEARKNLLAEGGIRHETATVSQPTIRQKTIVEKDGGDDAASDEERLQLASPYVGNIGNILVGSHRGIVFEMCIDDPYFIFKRHC